LPIEVHGFDDPFDALVIQSSVDCITDTRESRLWKRYPKFR
jgi:hypothetical protein